MSRTFFIVSSLLLLAQTQTSFALDPAGTWALEFSPRPKLTVIAFNQPFKKGLPPLPTSDSLTFSEDPDAPGTGTFTSTLFAGEWLLDGKKVLSSTTNDSYVESAMNQYLAAGEFYGYKFTDGKLLSSKSVLQAKERKGGTLKGSFTHISKWTVNLTEPKKIPVPVTVKLTAKFVGTQIDPQ